MGRVFEVLRPHTRATPTLVHGVAVPDVRDGQGVLGEQAVVALQHQHQFLRVSVLKADHQVLWGKKMVVFKSLSSRRLCRNTRLANLVLKSA